ncbi:hypothetical protein AQBE111736_13750 [Aquirufa beregesia]
MLAVATPLLKVMDVSVSKSVASIVAFVTGLVEGFAPENVNNLAPVYVVTLFPLSS